MSNTPSNTTTKPSSQELKLDREDLNVNPISQFNSWFKEYLKTNPPEPTAMAIATSSSDGLPSVRFVLMKEVDDKGFVFFTNYESAKGKTLASNPQAALAFYWNTLNRQVRVSGKTEKLSAAESDEYFATRPVESQLSAWASHQSTTVPDRVFLESRMLEFRTKYQNQPIPRPPYWGGLRVVPSQIEFWQGRVGRLHDRFLYVREGPGWKIERLSP